MKRWGLVIIAVVLGGSSAMAADAPEISVKADLELFYEASKGISGTGDGDKFKSNQLYLDFGADFEKGLSALLKLDGADIVGADGKVVTEKIVEEANFTAKDIGGSPVTVVFGKDEMPFGLDYDKHLNDSISHQFEIDKVWGLHGIVAVPSVGQVAAATYEHRHSLKTGESRVSADNQLGDNYSAALTVDKVVSGVKLIVSGASETYSDTTTKADDGTMTTHAKSDETRLGVGLSVDCPEKMGNVNLEYITFSNMGGSSDYDPSLITIGVEYNVSGEVVVWGRYEIIGEDTSDDVETDFWALGVAYSPVKNYTLSVEYANFSSLNMSDATDLKVAKDTLENSLLVGVRAQF